MMSSSRGFRFALATLALSALLCAPQAAQAAVRVPSAPAVAAGSLWEHLAAGIEAQLGPVLRLLGWTGSSSHGAGTRRPMTPGATTSGGSQSGTGSSADQGGAQDPDG
jgi:hypothetical protein